MSLLNAGIAAFSLIVMPLTGQTNINQTNIIDTVLTVEEISCEAHYMYAIAEMLPI